MKKSREQLMKRPGFWNGNARGNQQFQSLGAPLRIHGVDFRAIGEVIPAEVTQRLHTDSGGRHNCIVKPIIPELWDGRGYEIHSGIITTVSTAPKEYLVRVEGLVEEEPVGVEVISYRRMPVDGIDRTVLITLLESTFSLGGRRKKLDRGLLRRAREAHYATYDGLKVHRFAHRRNCGDLRGLTSEDLARLSEDERYMDQMMTGIEMSGSRQHTIPGKKTPEQILQEQIRYGREQEER